MELPVRNHRRGLWTLSPLLVFFLLYVVTSVVAGDFYTSLKNISDPVTQVKNSLMISTFT